MIAELASPILKEYLDKRGIPLRLASKFCKEALYKVGNKAVPVIAFPNDKGGYVVESHQICDVIGTRTLSTVKSENPGKTCMVFLHFMDFLSFHAQLMKDGWTGSLPVTDCIILNTYMQIGRACKALAGYRLFTCHFPNNARGEAALREMLSLTGCVSWGAQAMSKKSAASVFADYLAKFEDGAEGAERKVANG